MTDKVKALVAEIHQLEDRLEREIETQRENLHYTIREKRIEFETAAIERHKALRKSVLRFIHDAGVLNVLVSPVIYIQIVPIALLDLAVSLFQWIAFPVYKITKVPRGDFVVMDRHHLSYLNGIEKLNCAYCGYANGVLAYARAIAGRTEEYWCPIKHARKTKGQHAGYYTFAEYGDAEDYRRKSPEAYGHKDPQ